MTDTRENIKIRHSMPITRTLKGVLYHLIEFPFLSQIDAKTCAQKRAREYPMGKQVVLPSKDRKCWGAYEKVNFDKVREFDRKLGIVKGRKKK
jgi:hypothetical protein